MKIRNLLLTTIIVMVLLVMQVAPLCALDEVPQTDGGAILLYDANSGQVIYEKNADAQMTCASITKLMTAVVVVENLDLETMITVPKEAEWHEVVGNNMALREGEVVKAEDLLKVMVVFSASDAALTLAIETAGSVEAFIDMMNEKAEELGMTHTNYLSVNGFTESYDHTTTCEDLRILLDYIMEDDYLMEIVGLREYTVPETNYQPAKTYENTNRMISDEVSQITVNGETRTPIYEGTYGFKTGMMLSAGWCMAVGVERGDTNLVLIYLKGLTDLGRFEDGIAIYDWAFANYETCKVVESGMSAGTVKVKHGHVTEVETYYNGDFYLTHDLDSDLDYSLEWVYDEEIKAPLEEGDKVGVCNVYQNGELMGSVDLVVHEKVGKGGPWSYFYISDTTMFIVLIALVALIEIRSIIRKRKKLKQRAANK